MGKVHESAKAVRKQAALSMKEKKAAKQAKKQMPASPPFLSPHHQ